MPSSVNTIQCTDAPSLYAPSCLHLHPHSLPLTPYHPHPWRFHVPQRHANTLIPHPHTQATASCCPMCTIAPPPPMAQMCLGSTLLPYGGGTAACPSSTAILGPMCYSDSGAAWPRRGPGFRLPLPHTKTGASGVPCGLSLRWAVVTQGDSEERMDDACCAGGRPSSRIPPCAPRLLYNGLQGP